jgi:chemotaxis protein CheX
MTTVALDDELVGAVVEQVWESLLGAVARPWAGPRPAGATVPTVRAQVRLSGDWNGLVRLTCDPATAETLAAAMLMSGPDEALPEEDVLDAVGEVVNVVGGNVKGALVGRTSLGLPQVALAARAALAALPALPAVADDAARSLAVPTSRCVLDWHGAPVVVEVLGDDAPDVPDGRQQPDSSSQQAKTRQEKRKP